MQNEENTANVEVAETESQGLMGNVQEAPKEVNDEDQQTVPHLVSDNQEVDTDDDDDVIYERPDFIPEKFWDEKEGPDLEAIFKSNAELEKKFHRGDHKTPETYKLDVLTEHNVPEDDPMLQNFSTWAKANNISQAAFDDIVGSFLGETSEMTNNMKIVREDELKALGPNADAIITSNTEWIDGLAAKGIISKDEQQELYWLGDVANGQRIIQKIRGMTGDNQPIPTIPTAQAKMTQAEFKEHAQNLMQDPKYGSDPVYTKNVEKEFAEYYGT